MVPDTARPYAAASLSEAPSEHQQDTAIISAASMKGT